MTLLRAWLSIGIVAFLPTDAASAGRTVVRNAKLLMLSAEAPTAVVTDRTILVEDGRITAIKPPSDEDLRAGDMLVDAQGAWLLPGFIGAIEGPPPSYAALTVFPLKGITTIAARFGVKRATWHERLNREAAIHAPALVELEGAEPIDWQPLTMPSAEATPETVAALLILHSRERAAKLGLTDRGSIAIGQRGDFLIVEANPFEHPETLATPIEVVIGGETMRRSALETNRRTIAEADAALATLPAPAASELVYMVESSGLRVGRLLVANDGTKATDWWGPPVDQVTEWTLTSDAAAPLTWRLAMTQRLVHGFTIAMKVERRATDTFASAQLTAPELLPAAETTLAATPEQPFLDPISSAIRLRTQLAALAEGAFRDVEVVEPVPEPSVLKVGVRTLRFTRMAPESVPIPVDGGERVIQIDARLERPSPRSDETASPATATPISAAAGEAIAGWIVIDASGLPLRASLVAPEGITEYFVSLPQPAAASPPQVKRP